MKRLVILVLLVVASVALAWQSSPLSPWAGRVAALKSLRAEIKVQEIGQGAATYKVLLRKPASLRVEGPDETVVADGQTVTVFEPKENRWYTRPQDDALLKATLAPDAYALVRAFFDAGAFDGVAAKALPPKVLAGETVKPISLAFDAKGAKTMTVYVGADGLARKAERRLETSQGERVAVISAAPFLPDDAISDDELAFKAPADAQEVNYQDIIAAKWFTDLEQAKREAKRSGRKIFVDFFAVWCGPCKALEREVFSTDRFKKLSSKFVFLRIDVDLQPAVAQAFNIEAMPTQAVLKTDGSEEGRIVGYGGPEPFFDFIGRY